MEDRIITLKGGDWEKIQRIINEALKPISEATARTMFMTEDIHQSMLYEPKEEFKYKPDTSGEKRYGTIEGGLANHIKAEIDLSKAYPKSAPTVFNTESATYLKSKRREQDAIKYLESLGYVVARIDEDGSSATIVSSEDIKKEMNIQYGEMIKKSVAAVDKLDSIPPLVMGDVMDILTKPTEDIVKELIANNPISKSVDHDAIKEVINELKRYAVKSGCPVVTAEQQVSAPEFQYTSHLLDDDHEAKPDRKAGINFRP